MEQINQNNIDFPEELKNIKPQVKKIYVVGEKKNLKMKKIAIIGSRQCTAYGIKVAYEFAYKLAKAGICIVSGMALGIDKYAHLGALDAGGKTIAVLGGGFNYIFPEEHTVLYNRIIAENSTVITEYNPHTIPEKKNFPKRNRIISGISLGVLVVEAEYRSGASITAQYAKQQDKKIFCIPSNIDSSNGIGTNRLIKEGATLVTNVSEILKEIAEEKQVSEVPEEYEAIYNVIKNGTHQLNAICKKVNQTASEVMATLTMLEIEGYIQSLAGQEFILKEGI